MDIAFAPLAALAVPWRFMGALAQSSRIGMDAAIIGMEADIIGIGPDAGRG